MTDDSQLKLRLDYHVRQYAAYTTHANSIFNFYLIAIAFIGNAYVLSFATTNALGRGGSIAIASVGLLLTFLFYMIHRRSRTIMQTLQKLVKADEDAIGTDFLTKGKDGGANQIGHGTWFGLVFALIAVALVIALGYASCLMG